MGGREHLLEELQKGDAVVLIPELAKKQNIETVVMGTVVRTGIAGIVVGNTVENVLQQVNCSVLAIKPDGFVSPMVLW